MLHAHIVFAEVRGVNPGGFGGGGGESPPPPPPKFEIHSFFGQNSAIRRAKEEAGISKRI